VISVTVEATEICTVVVTEVFPTVIAEVLPVIPTFVSELLPTEMIRGRHAGLNQQHSNDKQYESKHGFLFYSANAAISLKPSGSPGTI
jgi:hypothetical protein